MKDIEINEINTQYDCIADVYESLFLDEESIKENNAVSQMLRSYSGSIFEIGCGTGLLLDLITIDPFDYYGCDPSKKMLDIFKKKHPLYSSRVELGTFEQNNVWKKYDNIVSIFGSISYVKQDFLYLIAESTSRLFLMFYKPNYIPVTYLKTHVHFLHYIHTKDQLKKIFKKHQISEFNNFLIISTV